MAKRDNKKIKVLSLFSGIGGLDLGFEKAGFEIVATVEWDKDCCDTLRTNKDKFLSKNTKIIQADITKINPKEIYSGKIDFFVGGPPCQTFSAIGRRAGGASGRLDDRGNLFKHYCRLLKHYSPAGFMFENVRGILSSNKGQDWKDVLAEFSSLGYELKYRVLDTAGYGVAQHRERVILVGYKKGFEFFFPRPTHGPDSLTKQPYVSAKEALKSVDHTEELNTLQNKGGKYDDLLADIPAGSNYLFYTEEMGHPRPKFAWRSKFSDFLYKASPDTPVKTIVASMGRYSGPFHWDSRKLSIGELLRLQGFPDGYKLSGGRTSKIKQIGNSVVPIFAYPLALAVKETIFGYKKNGITLLDDNEVLSIERRKTLKAKTTRTKRVGPLKNQLPLFGDNRPQPQLKLKSINYFLGYGSPNLMKLDQTFSEASEFTLSIEVKNDEIGVSLIKPELKSDKELVSVKLSLDSSSLGSVNSLKLTSNWYEAQRPYVIWDAINVAISTISHFPSIHELYGHFTEPNPKFTIREFDLPRKRDSVTKLLSWMSKFENTTTTKPLSILGDMGFDISDEKSLILMLRNKRIDIRTNMTNKRITDGQFRICYPYTLPIDRKTFVTIN